MLMVLVTGQVFSAGKRLHHTAIMLESPCYRLALLCAEHCTDLKQKGGPQNFLLMCYDESP